jgi:hypothetical protein
VVCRGVEYHAQSIVPLIEFPPAAVTDVSQSPYLQRLIRSDRVVARLCHGPIPTAGIDIAWTYSGFPLGRRQYGRRFAVASSDLRHFSSETDWRPEMVTGAHSAIHPIDTD